MRLYASLRFRERGLDAYASATGRHPSNQLLGGKVRDRARVIRLPILKLGPLALEPGGKR